MVVGRILAASEPLAEPGKPGCERPGEKGTDVVRNGVAKAST